MLKRTHCKTSRSPCASMLVFLFVLSSCSDPTEPTQTQQTAASVEVSAGNSTLSTLGATTLFTAVAKDASGTTIGGRTFDWSSSDEQVATIESSGMATAVCDGMTTITATTGSVSGSLAFTVAQSQTNFWMQACLEIVPVRSITASPANGHIFANNR